MIRTLTAALLSIAVAAAPSGVRAQTYAPLAQPVICPPCYSADAPPPPAYPPPAYAPPVACPPPPCCPPPQAALSAPRTLVEDPKGARLVIDEGGRLFRERQVRGTTPAVWVPGLVLWLGSYFLSAMPWGRPYENLPSLLPVLGAFGSAFSAGQSNDANAAALYALSGLTQAAGFVMFVAGASSGKSKLVRQRVYLSGGALGGGGGLTVAGRF